MTAIRPLQPVVELTPASCREVLRALDASLEVFKRWNVVAPSGSWIQQSAAWLERVIERDSLGETDEDLRRTSAAVAAIIDLYHISTCLGNESVRTIAVELAQITHGSLLKPAGQSDSLNFRTQFWVGALLAQSKLNPHVIAHEAKGKPKPDFMIESERVPFGVEVKLPKHRKSVVRNLDEAADQIRRRGRPGIIVIDATYCMSVDPFGITGPGATVRDQVNQDLRDVHHELVRRVETYRRSNKFHQVTMLITFARYWPWIVEEHATRDAGIHLRANGFDYLWSNEMSRITRKIQESLLGGVKQLTGNSPKYQFL